MDLAQPSRIRPTASNRRKKTGIRPAVDPNIPEIRDEPNPQVDAATESLALHIPRGVSQESYGIDETDSEEEEVSPINGGPYDLSLLKSFRTHVAFFISKNEERDPLRCINHMKKINTWPLESEEPNTRFVQYIRNSSLYPLTLCSYQYISSVELTAFVELWHPETNTFHLSFGEMTITLDDVACLLGLPVTGKSVSLSDRTDGLIAVEQLTESLGVGYNEVFQELNTKGGASVRLDWLRERFSGVTDADTELKILCAVRAYLLYLLGCTLFRDKSGTRVPVDYLALLHDVENVHTYAWGAGALAYLYRQLGLSSRAHAAQMSGYLTLLQAWIFAHFSSLMPVLNGGYRLDQPQACRWLSKRDNKVSLEHVRAVRDRLDTLTVNEVTWDPYRSFRETHPFQEVCFYMGTLKMKDIVESYHPVRVLRQFGRRQYIPPPPFRPIREKCGLTSKNYSVTYGHAEQMWLSWLDHVLAQEHQGVKASTPGECTHDYMPWYEKVSRRFIGASIHASNQEGAAQDVPQTNREDVPEINNDERIQEAIVIIDPFLEAGETRTKKSSLYQALVKIKSVLTGCKQTDIHTVAQPVAQSPSDPASSSRRRQPARKQPARKCRRI